MDETGSFFVLLSLHFCFLLAGPIKPAENEAAFSPCCDFPIEKVDDRPFSATCLALTGDKAFNEAGF
jgi:hypothetical protein